MAISNIITQKALEDLTKHIWSITLNIDLSSSNDLNNEGEYMTGCISIVGEKKFAVFLDCAKFMLC